MGRRAKKAPVSYHMALFSNSCLTEHEFLTCHHLAYRIHLTHPIPINQSHHPISTHHQVQTKKRITLARRFKCPFCANEDVVECVMKLREGTGSLSCRICDASFQMPIHHLHEPIDVFSEWLDACEAAEKGQGNTGGGNVEDDGDLLGSSFQQGTDGGKKSSSGQEKAAYASIGLGDSDDEDD